MSGLSPVNGLHAEAPAAVPDGYLFNLFGGEASYAAYFCGVLKAAARRD
jgi:hypothetical protein